MPHGKPPPTHNARWMSVDIYILLIILAGDQFELPADRYQKVKDVAKFIIYVFSFYWFSSGIAADAPVNFLNLWKDIAFWAQYDAPLAEAALKKLRSHLWYLHPRTVIYSLFSDKVELQRKEAMAQKLLLFKDHWESKIVIGKPNIECLSVSSDSKLKDFCTEESWLLHKITKIPFSFLSAKPDDWKTDRNYLKLEKIVKRMKITNDCGERWVKLGVDFAGKNCKYLGERHAMYQVVERERCQYPDDRKSTRSASLFDNLNEHSSGEDDRESSQEEEESDEEEEESSSDDESIKEDDSDDEIWLH